MEVTSEKKELDNKNTNSTQSLIIDPSIAAEDRERIAVDLKAGLHPLKVSFLFYFSTISANFILFLGSSSSNLGCLMRFAAILLYLVFRLGGVQIFMLSTHTCCLFGVFMQFVTISRKMFTILFCTIYRLVQICMLLFIIIPLLGC